MMIIEKIKSLAPGMGFVNLGKPLYELCCMSCGRIPYVLASPFEEVDVSNLFCGDCVTHSCSSHKRTIAMGFVLDAPTICIINSHGINIKPYFYMAERELANWQDAVFTNLFQLEDGEIRNDTCVYDEANDLLWDITFDGCYGVRIEIYHTYEYGLLLNFAQ